MLISFLAFGQTNPVHVKVKGYYKSDGTYVTSHYRTAPNSTNRDNFSTKGNLNPYTGEKGYVQPDIYPFNSRINSPVLTQPDFYSNETHNSVKKENDTNLENANYIIHQYYRFISMRRYASAYDYVDEEKFGDYEAFYFATKKKFGDINHLMIEGTEMLSKTDSELILKVAYWEMAAKKEKKTANITLKDNKIIKISN